MWMPIYWLIMQHVTSKCKINDNFKHSHVDGELCSNYSRNIYFKKNFAFVSPISMQLNIRYDTTEAATYQYVPILDSLKALLKMPLFENSFLIPQR